MHYLFPRRISPNDSYYLILTRGTTVEMTATYDVTYPFHSAYIVAGTISITNGQLTVNTPGNDYYPFTSGGSVFVNVPATGNTLTLTAFVNAHSGLNSSNFVNRPYVVQTLTFSTVAPPEIQSFARTDNTSTLQVSPGADFTLRAMFTGGQGSLTASPAFPFVTSLPVDPGVSYTYQSDVDRVYTLTVFNTAGTSISRTLAIDVVPNPVITSFNQSANNVAPNEAVTLTAFFEGGTALITPGNLSILPQGSVPVQTATTQTYTLTVTNTLNVSVMRQLTIDVDVVQSFITPTLDVQPSYVLRGNTFQVQYLVPIAVTAASVTVVMTDQSTGQVFIESTVISPADFTVVSSSEDTTSVPGGRRVTTLYDLTVGAQSVFVNRYGNNFVRLDISIQGPGISLSQELYIEGDY
jgi:hypothetical protein